MINAAVYFILCEEAPKDKQVPKQGWISANTLSSSSAETRSE